MRYRCSAIEAGGTKFICGVGTGPEGSQARKNSHNESPGDCRKRGNQPFFSCAGTLACRRDRFLRPGGPGTSIHINSRRSWLAESRFRCGVVRAGWQVPVGFDIDTNAPARRGGALGRGTRLRQILSR